MKILFIQTYSRCIISKFIAILPILVSTLAYCYPKAYHKPFTNPKLSTLNPRVEHEIRRFGRVVLISDGDEEESYDVPSNTWRSDTADYSHCLLGCVLMRKPVIMESLGNTLTRTMNSLKGIQISHVGEDRFLLTYNHVLDRQWVMECSRWTFDKYPINLVSAPVDADLATVPLTHCDFLVHAPRPLQQRPNSHSGGPVIADLRRNFSSEFWSHGGSPGLSPRPAGRQPSLQRTSGFPGDRVPVHLPCSANQLTALDQFLLGQEGSSNGLALATYANFDGPSYPVLQIIPGLGLPLNLAQKLTYSQAQIVSYNLSPIYLENIIDEARDMLGLFNYCCFQFVHPNVVAHELVRNVAHACLR